jgi:hypothetical protein
MKTDKKSQVINRSDNKIVLYTDKRGNVELRADVEKDTIWATQAQISRLFDVNIPTVNEHLKNILKTRELQEASTIRKFRIVQDEGGHKVSRDTNFYNLDAIIAVGYRVNSKKATKFRIWATRILRECLIKGFNLDRRKIALGREARGRQGSYRLHRIRIPRRSTESQDDGQVEQESVAVKQSTRFVNCNA